MSIYKRTLCICGYNRNEPEPKKKAPACPKCGVAMEYSEKWYISYYHNTKKIVEAVSPVKKDAVDRLGKIRGEIRENKFFDKNPSIPWDKAVEEFEVWLGNNCKDTTEDFYLDCLKPLNEYFGGFTIDEINAQMVEKYRTERKKVRKCRKCKIITKDPIDLCPKCERPLKSVTMSTINREIATLKRMFSLAEEVWTTGKGKPFLARNLIRKVKLVSEKTSKRTRYLEKDEMDKLIAACGTDQLRLAVIIALDTGLRKHGVVSLSVSPKDNEIDFGNNEIRKQVKRDTTVIIPMTERVKREIKEYLARNFSAKYLFPSRHPITGKILKDNEHIRVDADMGFDAALKRAGISNFRFHDLRHTFATHFYRRTKDWKALQEILGHADIQTTMNTYAHLMDDAKKESMKAFSDSM